MESIVATMRNAQQNVAYNDLYKVCVHYFGEPRQSGSFHAVFKTSWQGDPGATFKAARAKPRRTKCVRCSKR